MSDEKIVNARGVLALLFLIWAIPGSEGQTPSSFQMPLYGDHGAHDPSRLIKEGGVYSVFITGPGIIRKTSSDLRNWAYAGQIFPNGPPSWTTNAVPAFDGTFWAPDIVFFGGRYNLYYAVSQFGTIDSAIGLVTTPSLTTPVWTDRGKVLQSDPACCTQPGTDVTSINCIDPSILLDANGTVWMTFGSYFDGIAVTQLDPATGKRLNPTVLPTKIASSTSVSFGNTTEASFLYQHGGYYYLFLNYGGCCAGIDSTYNIRVGRSTSVTGPYVDEQGRSMLNGGGTVLLESTGRFIGPGHAGILEENGTNWFTYHYYDGTNNGAPMLGLATFSWIADWPVMTNDWSAFYPFNTGAKEHSGLYNGTLQNRATITNDSSRGAVLNLDGATNYVSLPISVANARTFAAWVKWYGGDAWQRIFDFGAGTSSYFYLSPKSGAGNLRFAIKTSASASEQQINTPSPLPTNSWVHLAVTLDGAVGTLYLNGVAVARNNAMTIAPWQTLARNLYIGRSQFAADPMFSGRIDSYRIFGRALSEAEIVDLTRAHPDLANRYSFSSSGWDSIGMAHGRLMGSATVSNRSLVLNGATGTYLNLPGGIVSGSSSVTLEAWANFSVNGNWPRLFDFGDINGAVGINYLFLSPHSSAGGTRLGMTTTSGSVNFDSPGTFDNQTLHVVCIVDPSKNYAAIYTNNVLRNTYTGAFPPLNTVSSAWSFIGRSLWSADAWLNATIDEFRIYDGHLTPGEIAIDYQSGPDALALPVPIAVTSGPTTLALSWPSWALGFTLESTTDFLTWTPTGSSPILGNDRWFVSIPKSQSATFYRLRR